MQIPQPSAALAKVYPVNVQFTDKFHSRLLGVQAVSTKATADLVLQLRRVHKAYYDEYETLKAAERKKIV